MSGWRPFAGKWLVQKGGENNPEEERPARSMGKDAEPGNDGETHGVPVLGRVAGGQQCPPAP